MSFHRYRFVVLFSITCIARNSDGVSVTSLSPSPTTVIVVPPDISSVTLSWNYALDSGEAKFVAIKIERTKGATTTNELVDHRSDNPSDPGVKEAFRSRVNFTISGNNINLLINNVTADDGNGFIYQCQVISDKFNVKSARVQLVVRVAAHNVATVCDQAIFGKAVTCNCTADGAPVPTRFQWRAQNGTLLHNGSSYTTPRVEQSLDGSYYTCVASNGYGPEARRNTTLFNVLDKPSIAHVSPHPSAPVNETGSVILQCQASGGNPAVYSYKWQHNGNDIRGGEDGTLELTNVNRTQDGNYTCLGCNIIGCARNTTNLTVQYKPSSAHVSPHPSVTVNETSNVTLQCRASGGNPDVYSYKWKHNGNDISGGEDGTLELTNVNRHQIGSYTCSANNKIGFAKGTTNLIVQFSATITSVISRLSPVCEGEQVVLTCAAYGNPRPFVAWKRNGRLLQNTTNTSFAIQSVTRADEGSYTCLAKNAGGSMSNIASIKDVQYSAKVNSLSASQTLMLDERVDLNCSVEGDPPPYVAWIHVTDGSVLQNRTVDTSYVIPRVSSHHKGTYRCVTGNRCGRDSRDTTVLDIYASPILAHTDPTNRNVRVSESSSFTLFCNASGIPKPTISWRTISNTSLQFPDGNWLTVISATQQHNGTYQCHATNEAGSVRATFDVVVYSYSIIDAEIRLDLTWDEALSDPYSQKYQSLRLLLKTAISESYGTTSLLSDVLVQGFRKGSVIATFQMIFAENKSEPLLPLQTFLKNHNFILGGMKVHLPVLVARRTDSDKVKCTNTSTGTIAALATITTLLSLALICLTIYVWWKVFKKGSLKATQEPYEMPTHVIQNPAVLPKAQNQRRSEGNSNKEPSLQKQYMQLLPITSRGHSSKSTDNTTSSPDYMALSLSSRSWEVARNKITVNKVIGKGAFGQVAKGTAVDLPGKGGKVTVAIKMLKGNASTSDRKDLLSELNLMKQLKPHRHVIRLLGCVTEDEPLMVIIEYVPYGDLLGYLRKSRGLHDTYYKDPDVKPRTNLTSKQLIKLAWQIADGMSYLAFKKIVHRDLAARNVLVGENEQCKVTDFGLARDVHEEGFYEKKTKGSRLPVKWMAFESLIHRTYSTETDVWSYGVVLYELFTIGGCPYPKIPGREIPKVLEQGYRMPKPQHVDQHLYQVMIDCWQENPGARPTFEDLRDKMKSFEGHHQTYVNLKNYNEKLYGNVEDWDV